MHEIEVKSNRDWYYKIKKDMPHDRKSTIENIDYSDKQRKCNDDHENHLNEIHIFSIIVLINGKLKI